MPAGGDAVCCNQYLLSMNGADDFCRLGYDAVYIGIKALTFLELFTVSMLSVVHVE